MCVGGGSPEPDINKPDYPVDDISKHIDLTMTDKKGNTSDLEQIQKAAYGDGPVTTSGSGISMRTAPGPRGV